MNSGNLKNLRVGGKLILDVSSHEGDARYLPVGPDGLTWTASIRGWHRSRNVGVGSTRNAAISDLAEKCGVTVQDLLDDCLADAD